MKKSKNTLCAELLILPDGRILVHNLTQPIAELLRKLNPRDKAIAPRAKINVGQASRLSKEPLERKIDRRDACPPL
jgi:hypothetical protein